jgi:dihydrofolate reductase
VNAAGSPHPVISLVAAVADGGVIGDRGGLPWRLPADLAHFRVLTMGHTLVVGRKTFQSIGRALPGRRTIVLTREPGFRAPGCTVAGSLDEAITACGGGEIFVIGGASIYSQFLPLASRLFITRIAATVAGDAFFPAIDPAVWRLVEQVPGIVDAANPLPHEFQIWRRTTA